MLELSLHILDIIENSLRAKAKKVLLKITEKLDEDVMKIEIKDDGTGMKKAQKIEAVSPFNTTKKKKKKIGLGLPLFKQIADHCGGNFSLNSEPGKGTEVCATFQWSHVDRPPLGDIPETIQTVIAGESDINFKYLHKVGSKCYKLDTKEIKRELDDVDISNPRVVAFIKSDIEKGLKSIRPNEYLGEDLKLIN